MVAGRAAGFSREFSVSEDWRSSRGFWLSVVGDHGEVGAAAIEGGIADDLGEAYVALRAVPAGERFAAEEHLADELRRRLSDLTGKGGTNLHAHTLLWTLGAFRKGMIS